MTSVNCTIEELKHCHAAEQHIAAVSVNCTIEELKHAHCDDQQRECEGVNCTIEELKPFQGNYNTLINGALIVPLRN